MVEKIDNHSLASLISILVSIVFYLQIILTIKDKDKEIDVITLIYTFLTLYTLYGSITVQYNKLINKEYKYLPLMTFLFVDTVMTILLTVFVFYDFSKMSKLRYMEHPYYKYMLYISYIMLVLNIIYFVYILFNLFKGESIEV